MDDVKKVLQALWAKPFTAIGVLILLFAVSVVSLYSIFGEDLDQQRQHPVISKLAPFSRVKILNVAGGSWVPYEKIDFEPGRVLVQYSGRIRSINLAEVCFESVEHGRGASYDTLTGNYFIARIGEPPLKIDEVALRNLLLSEHLGEKTFVFGTDAMGREVLLRLIAGGKTSMFIGFSAVAFALVVGLLIGVLAGYFGGAMDRVLMWLINLFWSVPAVLMVVAVTLALGTGVGAIVLGISLVLWVETAQVTRFAVRAVRGKDYIKAARLMGLSHAQIIRRHILPNVTAPVAVISASSFADAIILESGLSFLGIGVVAPGTSWGSMIRESYGYLISGNDSHLALIPSATLIIVVLSFVFVSNGIKESSDVFALIKKRGSI